VGSKSNYTRETTSVGSLLARHSLGNTSLTFWKKIAEKRKGEITQWILVLSGINYLDREKCDVHKTNCMKKHCFYKNPSLVAMFWIKVQVC
jgi:hypothetical protein